jgi:hypothetical protein
MRVPDLHTAKFSHAKLSMNITELDRLCKYTGRVGVGVEDNYHWVWDCVVLMLVPQVHSLII